MADNIIGKALNETAERVRAEKFAGKFINADTVIYVGPYYLDDLATPKIAEGKVVKLGVYKDISISKKLYSEIEDFFNRVMVAVEKESLTIDMTKWRERPTNERMDFRRAEQDRMTRQTVKDLLKNPKTRGEKIIAAWIKSKRHDGWLGNLIEALIDHTIGLGESCFSKDHFFGNMVKKEFDAIMKETQPARRKAKGKLQEFKEAAANSNGAAKTTKGKKADTAKRMRRAKTDVTTVKTEAPRARDAKPVEVEVPKIDVKRLPKVRG